MSFLQSFAMIGGFYTFTTECVRSDLPLVKLNWFCLANRFQVIKLLYLAQQHLHIIIGTAMIEVVEVEVERLNNTDHVLLEATRLLLEVRLQRGEVRHQFGEVRLPPMEAKHLFDQILLETAVIELLTEMKFLLVFELLVCLRVGYFFCSVVVLGGENMILCEWGGVWGGWGEVSE